MTFFQAVILGFIEGLTEFLPVSSTAHLILATKWLGIAETDFVKSFVVVIQFGAILAVIWLYRKRLWQEPALWRRALTAFLPTAIIGFLLYKLIKGFLFESELVILLALTLGGLILIVFERWHRAGEQNTISAKQSLIIGGAQALAVIPGVSRAAATIVGGLALGLSRRAIVEFSFILAIPTMLAATSYDLWQSGANFAPDDWFLLLVGLITAFISALIGIKFFLRLIERWSFVAFGLYRILFAGLVYLWLAL